MDEPYPETRTAPAPDGRISDPRAAIPLALFLMAIGVLVLVLTFQDGKGLVGIVVCGVTWGLGLTILRIGLARWRWMRTVRSETGSYPEV